MVHPIFKIFPMCMVKRSGRCEQMTAAFYLYVFLIQNNGNMFFAGYLRPIPLGKRNSKRAISGIAAQECVTGIAYFSPGCSLNNCFEIPIIRFIFFMVFF